MIRKILLSTFLSCSLINANDFEDFQEFDNIEPKIKENKYLTKYNQVVTDFNYELYSYTIIPLLEMYDLLPEDIKKVVKNFFSNVNKPYSIINNILQDKSEMANKELKIFLINSTIGFFGFNDIAEEQYGLKDSIENLKTTADYYEIPQGTYFVLPIVGPTTIRNSILDLLETQIKSNIYSLKENINQGFIILNDLNNNKDSIMSLKMLKTNQNKNEIIKKIYLNKGN